MVGEGPRSPRPSSPGVRQSEEVGAGTCVEWKEVPSVTSFYQNPHVSHTPRSDNYHVVNETVRSTEDVPRGYGTLW